MNRPRTPLDVMIDEACGIAAGTCSGEIKIGGKCLPHPDDLIECLCGEVRKINTTCSAPERCSILSARARCLCRFPGATRRECRQAKRQKSPCRCHCHTRLPEEREAERLFFWVVLVRGDATEYLAEGSPNWSFRQRDALRMSRAKARICADSWNRGLASTRNRVVRVRRRR